MSKGKHRTASWIKDPRSAHRWLPINRKAKRQARAEEKKGGGLSQEAKALRARAKRKESNRRAA